MEWKEDSNRAKAVFVCISCKQEEEGAVGGAQVAAVQHPVELPVERPLERPVELPQERPRRPTTLALREEGKEEGEPMGRGKGKRVIRAPVGFTPSPIHGTRRLLGAPRGGKSRRQKRRRR